MNHLVNQSKKKINILIVDDDKADAFYLKEMISKNKEALGIQNIEMESTIEAAKKRLKSPQFFHVIFLDFHLPDSQNKKNEFEGLEKLIQLSPQSVVLVVTGNTLSSLGIRAIQHGAHDFLLKEHLEPNLVKKAISFSLERSVLYREFLFKEQELKKTNEKLKKANNAKSEFLAKMSHEIRTPLNLIMGVADLLKETPLSSQQKIYVDKFERSGTHLLSVINDILDFSKIESSEMNLQKENFNFIDFIEEIIDFTSIHCRSKKLKFLYQVKKIKKTPHLIADLGKLRQILLNLINNALKFTKEGHLKLKFSLTHSSVLKKKNKDQVKMELVKSKNLNCKYLFFSISDTGPGIPKKKLNEVFKTFYQLNTIKQGNIKGTGLGLAIVKGLVQFLNGKIEIRSKVNRGSTFSVEIPLEIGLSLEEKKVKRDREVTAFKKILVATSSSSESKYICDVLSENGIQTFTVSSGEEVQNLIDQKKHEEFDLMFIDLHMNDFGGLVLSEKNKNLDYRKIVFLVPCIHRKNDIELIREKKGALFFLKPSKRKEIEDLIFKSNEKKKKPKISKSKKESKKEKPKKLTPLKILIAEDDIDNTFLFKAFFSQLKDKITYVPNGKEALENVKKGSYDLVFMDIQMPLMDGIEASTKIKEFYSQSRKQESITIYGLSAYAITDYIKKIPKGLFKRYITKPIKKEVLLGAVEGFRKEHIRQEKKRLNLEEKEEKLSA